MGAIRGAICAENTAEDISEKSVALFKDILEKNRLEPSDVDAVFFSVTKDLNACYPAESVRKNFAMKNAAFMCFAEMNAENGLPKCIRVCVFTEKISQKDCVHRYIGEAAVLRKDLV